MMFNTSSVMSSNPGKVGIPYLGGGGRGPLPAIPGKGAPSAQQQPQATLGPESVRATGTGPFDPAYRQNLATFAGGLFARPGGNLSFNPTSQQPFGGQATGGGNAPVLGMPSTLAQSALGGNPFSFTPPQPVNASPGMTTQDMQWWLSQFGGG
jgi:hypothetical protein